jgi:hypothetical protein
MSTHPNAGHAPFTLPLRISNGPNCDIWDSAGAFSIRIYEYEHSPDSLKEKRDYVIAAVNSFPLLEEMRERLEAMTQLTEAVNGRVPVGPLPGYGGKTFSENIHASRELLAKADALKPCIAEQAVKL